MNRLSRAACSRFGGVTLARRPKDGTGSTFSFNNLTVLKRAIYYYGPQFVDELAEHVRQALPPTSRESSSLRLREIYVTPALTRQRYFRELPDGRWDIEWDQAQAHENSLAARILMAERLPMPLNEIRKRVAQLMAKPVDEVQIDLEADPRFAAVGTNSYALSEWQLLNDDAYELLSRDPGRHLTEAEIISKLTLVNHFIQDSVVFAPKADNRFQKGSNGTWGLAEWSPSGARKTRQVEESLGLPTPVVVTPEQMIRVDSQAAVIEAFVRASSEAIRPRQIVEYILRVQVGTPDYPHLVRAVTLFLTQHEEYLRVGPDQWRLKAQVPPDVWEPTARVSAPRVRDLSAAEYTDDDEVSDDDGPSRSTPVGPESKAGSWKVALRFINWREGTLRVPATKTYLFSSSTESILELSFLIFGSVSHQYPVWFNDQTQMLYGLRAVYDTLGMLPGSVFHLSTSNHRYDQFILNYRGEVNPQVQREQSRLMDIGSLKRRAEEVGRSFRQILIDVLQKSPGGLTFWEAFDEVSHVRPVAISTLRNLLSSLPCFYQQEVGAGRWYFDHAKPTSRPQRRNLRLTGPRKLIRTVKPAGETSEVLADRARVPHNDSGTDRLNESRPGNDPAGDHRLETVVPPTGRHADSKDIVIDREQDHASVMERVAALLREGVDGDKAIIREYLGRFHGVSIDRGFLDIPLPPAETIRRARRVLVYRGAIRTFKPKNRTSVRGRVRSLLRNEELRRDDRRLIATYYRQFHGIRISEKYLDGDVPTMETIRRARLTLT